MRSLRRGAVLFLPFLAAACDLGPRPPTPAERKEYIRELEARTSQPGEAHDRRERSMARLRAEGVPVAKSLPVIASERESRRRTSQEVAARALALALVATRADGASRAQIDSLIREYRAETFFSPDERAFLASPSPSDQERAQFVWRYEAACVLMWALGYVDSLARPEKPCEVSQVVGAITSRGRDGFIRDARLRPQGEILDQADLTYRYHWATEEARLHNRAVPAWLSSDVVMERHHALNWLIGYMGQEWDDVSTDT